MGRSDTGVAATARFKLGRAGAAAIPCSSTGCEADGMVLVADCAAHISARATRRPHTLAGDPPAMNSGTASEPTLLRAVTSSASSALSSAKCDRFSCRCVCVCVCV